jgi:hypothetical protein
VRGALNRTPKSSTASLRTARGARSEIDRQLRADELDQVRPGEGGLLDARGGRGEVRFVERDACSRAPRRARFDERRAVQR